ncbi:hypothetical protein B0T22DRAFT_276507 [Podospora appendiculata]|uniref:Uncharacterized protein n=1 Tax=Podospora appendiculata TaxID=314037 RepID=A0AAE0X0D4_9PEZI|nr:hypothetical protein B0T22DRAFT_276507 [Podospora appendiculata]
MPMPSPSPSFHPPRLLPSGLPSASFRSLLSFCPPHPRNRPPRSSLAHPSRSVCLRKGCRRPGHLGRAIRCAIRTAIRRSQSDPPLDCFPAVSVSHSISHSAQLQATYHTPLICLPSPPRPSNHDAVISRLPRITRGPRELASIQQSRSP